MFGPDYNKEILEAFDSFAGKENEIIDMNLLEKGLEKNNW